MKVECQIIGRVIGGDYIYIGVKCYDIDGFLLGTTNIFASTVEDEKFRITSHFLAPKDTVRIEFMKDSAGQQGANDAASADNAPAQPAGNTAPAAPVDNVSGAPADRATPSGAANAAKAPVIGKIYTADVTDFLSLRISPSTRAARIEKLGGRAKVKVLDIDRDFARVQAVDSGLRGYVLWSYLDLASSQSVKIPSNKYGTHMVVCNDGLSLRDKASRSAERIEMLYAGELVEVYSYNGEFAYVGSQVGNSGYVLTSYLSATDYILND
jgi:hypothetical protein